MTVEKAPAPTSLSEKLRPMAAVILKPIARGLIRLHVTADALTIIGTLLMALAGGLAAAGNLLGSAVLMLVSAPLDALDGTVARMSGVKSQFGAFLDSTSDRYADGFVLGGILIYGLNLRDDWIVVLAFVSLWGSLLISYTRARAEGLNVECKVGLLTRMERFVLLIAMLVFNQVLPGLVIFAILTHFTALQRIFYVWRAMRVP